MKAVGNEKGNQLWEATASSNDKPKPTDERAKKEKWIRSKYVQKLFLPKQTVSDPVILKEVFKRMKFNFFSMLIIFFKIRIYFNPLERV